MKTFAVIGSRNPEGKTARATDALLQGAAAAGSSADSILLPEKRIERCRQCDERGWGLCLTDGRCAIEDDFGPVMEGLRDADVAVFATPVYFGDLSESMRAFLDRLRRCLRFEPRRAGIEEMPAVGICVAGGGGGGATSCALSLEKALATCAFNVLDVIPVRRQNLELKLDILRRTGEWLPRGIPPPTE